MTADAMRASEQDEALSDDLWSELQTFRIEIQVRKGVPPAAVTWEVLAERFDRSFRIVAFYVGQRVSDRARFKSIVIEVLGGNLDLFTTPCEEVKALRRLKASADRLIALRP